MTVEELQIVLQLTAEGVDGSIGELVDGLQKVGDGVDKVKKKSDESAAAAAALAAACAAAFAGIKSAIDSGTEAASKYEAAMQGLNSVASSRGIGQDAMQQALSQVTDGFMSAGAAATAYKNLLTRGYTLDQATNTIIRLKDAAAFGRQANLSLEEAVVTASEGIKNENSVLVNAA